MGGLQESCEAATVGYYLLILVAQYDASCPETNRVQLKIESNRTNEGGYLTSFSELSKVTGQASVDLLVVVQCEDPDAYCERFERRKTETDDDTVARYCNTECAIHSNIQEKITVVLRKSTCYKCISCPLGDNVVPTHG